MRFYLRLLCPLLCLTLVLPLLGQDVGKKDARKADVKNADDKKGDDKKGDDKKGDDKKGKKGEDEPKKKKLVWGQVIQGKLTKTGEGSDAGLTVQLTFQIRVPRPEAQRELLQRQASNQQRYLQILQQQNPLTRQQQLLQYQLEMARQQPIQMFNVQSKTKDVDLKVTDETVYRTPAPPPDYDAKGNLKVYKLKELQEMRGKEGYPGFPGTADSLRAGQIVDVYLARQQPQKKEKGKKLEDADPALEENRQEAVMIVIRAEPKQ